MKINKKSILSNLKLQAIAVILLLLSPVLEYGQLNRFGDDFLERLLASLILSAIGSFFLCSLRRIFRNIRADYIRNFFLIQVLFWLVICFHFFFENSEIEVIGTFVLACTVISIIIIPEHMYSFWLKIWLRLRMRGNEVEVKTAALREKLTAGISGPAHRLETVILASFGILISIITRGVYENEIDFYLVFLAVLIIFSLLTTGIAGLIRRLIRKLKFRFLRSFALNLLSASIVSWFFFGFEREHGNGALKHLLVMLLLSWLWFFFIDKIYLFYRKTVMKLNLTAGDFGDFKEKYLAKIMIKHHVETTSTAPSAPVKEGPGLKEKVKAGISGTGATLKSLPGRIKSSAPAVFLRRHRRKAVMLLILLVILAGIGTGARIIYDRMFLRIQELTPTGEVTDSIQIRVVYNGDFEIPQGLSNTLNIFQIEPPVPGTYHFPDKRTIIFIPDEKLMPSTDYKVKMDTSILKTGKKYIESPSFEFNTYYFRLQTHALFFTYNPMTKKEKDIVAELSFNYPVEKSVLRDHLSMNIEGTDIPFKLESSASPDRYYLKAKAPSRTQQDQDIEVVIEKGLSCIGGTIPTQRRIAVSSTLQKKVPLTIDKIDLHHMEGKSMVAILFNKPVDKDMIKSHLKVEPALPYTIDTEYRYVVVNGDFQPNVTYKLKIAKGLSSIDGNLMKDEYTHHIQARDMDPEVGFASESRIIPLKGNFNLRYYSVNLDKVNFTINKIYRNNLVYYLQNTYAHYNYGQHVDDFNVKVHGELNKKNYDTLNLKEYHFQKYKGLYRITLSDPKSYRDSVINVLATDIGLVVKKDNNSIYVSALSISDLSPLSGVKLQVMSRQNQVIKEKYSDAAGMVNFENIYHNEHGFHPYMIIASRGDDLAFYEMGNNYLNQSRFSVYGEQYDPKGLSAFVTPERGVYRPGEKAYITVLVRKKSTELPTDVPMYLEINGPTGETYKKIRTSSAGGALKAYTVKFPSHVKTGVYDIYARLSSGGDSIGYSSLKVEEFIPNKLKVKISKVGEHKAGAPVRFKVKANLLFGPPAKNHRVNTEVRFYSYQFSHKDFPGYSFYDDSRDFQSEYVDFGDEELDDNGELEYSPEIPENITPPSGVSVHVYSQVYDSSGRPVSGVKVLNTHKYPYYIGLKIANQGKVKPGQTITVDYAAIQPDGKKVSVTDQELMVYRKSYYSIFRRNFWGYGRFSSESYEKYILYKTINIKGSGRISFKTDKAGDYFISLGTAKGHRAMTSINVDDDSQIVRWDLENPSEIDINADKGEFMPGDYANVTLKLPFKGRLIYSIERDRVLESRTVTAESTSKTISIPVKASYFPNVYLTAILVRTPDPENDNLPMTAYGVFPLKLDSKSHENKITITTADKTSSDKGITVDLKTAQPNSEIVLAAVDRGILQITGFQTPDPLEFFTRKVGLNVESYSAFDDVQPDYLNERSAEGGGIEEDAIDRKHLNPIKVKRVKSFALFSGILRTDASGNVRHHFKTPRFNGEVRLMALTAKGGTFGSADRAVTIADKIIVDAGIPRFMAPGDEFFMPVTVYNQTGKNGIFKYTVQIKGPIKVKETLLEPVSIKDKDEKKILIPVTALNNAGKVELKIIVTGNDERSRFESEFAVRPVNTLETKIKSGRLKPGKTAQLKVPPDYIQFGQRLRVSAADSRIIQYLKAADYLIAYPYGCIEQTTSRVFPLIYFKKLGLSETLFPDKASKIDYYITAGIKRICSMQNSDGSFSYWPGGNYGNDYSSLYAMHCLLEAKNQGYSVPSDVLNRIRSYLQQGQLNETGTLDRRDHNVVKSHEQNVYKLYVMSIAGICDKGSLNHLYEKQLKVMEDGSRAILALGMNQCGMPGKAKACLPNKFGLILKDRLLGGDFYSRNRSYAQYLLAETLVRKDRAKIISMIDTLGKRMNKQGHFGSTQDNAWMFIALSKASQLLSENATISGAVYKDRTKLKSFAKNKFAILEKNNLAGNTIIISNSGTAAFYYNIMSEGTRLKPGSKSVFEGVKIERRYRNIDGGSVKLESVKQGELIAVELHIKPQDADYLDNMVVVDLLPAGFEIENPRLKSRGSLGYTPHNNWSSPYMDIRDDRIILFTRNFDYEMVYTYVVRAVTPGTFTIPELLGEAMYDPGISGRFNQGGKLTVAPVN